MIELIGERRLKIREEAKDKAKDITNSNTKRC